MIWQRGDKLYKNIFTPIKNIFIGDLLQRFEIGCKTTVTDWPGNL